MNKHSSVWHKEHSGDVQQDILPSPLREKTSTINRVILSVASVLAVWTIAELIWGYMSEIASKARAVVECDSKEPYLRHTTGRILCYTPWGRNKFKTKPKQIIPKFTLWPIKIDWYRLGPQAYDSEVTYISRWRIQYKWSKVQFPITEWWCETRVRWEKLINRIWPSDNENEVDSCIWEER